MPARQNSLDLDIHNSYSITRIYCPSECVNTAVSCPDFPYSPEKPYKPHYTVISIFNIITAVIHGFAESDNQHIVNKLYF